jgi:hypothetical protein
MPVPSGQRGRLLATAALLALLAACRDSPTAPEALRVVAAGRDWIAIAAPSYLPTTATWAPFLLKQGDGGRAIVSRVKALERQAERSRKEGEFARASDLRREASDLAVRSLVAVPSADIVLESAGGVDRWLRSVEAVGLEHSPLVAETVDSVRAGRAAARGDLAAGDTLGAVRHIMAATEQIRRWSPPEIAWRALRRAEAAVAAMPDGGADRVRARRLVQGSRLELRTGDPFRALERALYALQLADGAQVNGLASDIPGACGEKGC